MDISQEEKASLLEKAVINCTSVEELSRIYDELKPVEMTAPALGLACRYRGLETVRAMVEMGITFDFPSDEEIEKKYHCYVGKNYGNYRTNYALYLLKIFRGDLKGACCLKGLKLYQSAKRDAGKPLPFISDNERVEVLNYLYENRTKISFEPEEMLYYAVFAKDAVTASELKKRGVSISNIRVHTIANGGMSTDGYWHEYGAMIGSLDSADYQEIMEELYLQINRKPFHFTEKVYELTKKQLVDVKSFEFFLSHFKREKMNKYKIVRDLISADAAEALAVAEREGWLDIPKKRDELIDFARENGKTEALAYLLDFKNRTADFDAENKRAEKRMMAELNASPDSVMMLKKIWNYKKLEDGTLMITCYKGTDLEVAVPEKIGRSIVTAIGNGAFAGASGLGAGSVLTRGTFENMKHRRSITKITLPDTIQYIDTGAFADMLALKDINIPKGVREIGNFAFYECKSLKSFTVPGTVEKIGMYAFARCYGLEKVCIQEGVIEIGARAFMDCQSLKEVIIPASVSRFITATTGYSGFNVFSGCGKLCIYCPEGSKAQEYCREKGFNFRNNEQIKKS